MFCFFDEKDRLCSRAILRIPWVSDAPSRILCTFQPYHKRIGHFNFLKWTLILRYFPGTYQTRISVGYVSGTNTLAFLEYRGFLVVVWWEFIVYIIPKKRERLQCFFWRGLQFALLDFDLFEPFLEKFVENGVEVLGAKHSNPVLKIYERFKIFTGSSLCYKLVKVKLLQKFLIEWWWVILNAI